MKRIQSIVAAAVLALGASAFAGPVAVDFSSTQNLKGLGSFTGNAIYNDTTDQLSVEITNTSPSRGSLTAFAFDTEAGDAAKYVHPRGAPWKDDRNRKDVINAKPYGKFDAGAAIHGQWGSTAAKAGIGAGKTGLFVFDVTGPNASTLTTTDFFNSTTPEIVATFAGFKHNKTDRASGFGSAAVTTAGVLGTSTNDQPVLKIIPPVVILTPPGGNTIPINNNSGGPSAVQLPAAAPAGMGMLALFGLARFTRRMRGAFA